ncbi:MAG: glycosyltransferase family 2 protein [Armatimonadota bacterium]
MAFRLIRGLRQDEGIVTDAVLVRDAEPASRQGVLNELSVFFPAHNEEENIAPLVRSALEVLPAFARRFEIIVVDDGSSDGTRQEAERLARRHGEVRCVSHPHNRGYGGALKTGLREARCEWVFFTDADRQFDLSELGLLVAEALKGADVVIGYRRRRRDPAHRSINAALYRTMIRLLFGLKVRDIDCAFKLLRAGLVRDLPLKSEGALISAELLIRLRKRGARIKEVPVTHYPRVAGKQSGASLRVILRMFRELFSLARELRAEERAPLPRP